MAKSMGKCNDKIQAELFRLVSKASGMANGNFAWASRHVAAFESPRFGERPIVGLFKFLADYADHHESTFGRPVGEDGVLGAEWLRILKSARQLLNGELGRLDGGSLDRLAYQLGNVAGFLDSEID